MKIYLKNYLIDGTRDLNGSHFHLPGPLFGLSKELLEFSVLLQALSGH